MGFLLFNAPPKISPELQNFTRKSPEVHRISPEILKNIDLEHLKKEDNQHQLTAPKRNMSRTQTLRAERKQDASPSGIGCSVPAPTTAQALMTDATGGLYMRNLLGWLKLYQITFQVAEVVLLFKPS